MPWLVGAAIVSGIGACGGADDQAASSEPGAASSRASRASTPPVQIPAADLAAAIRAALDAPRARTRAPLAPAEVDQLERLYGAGNHAPLWLDAAGRPSGDARDALALLAGAAADGLEPGDYEADDLNRQSSLLSAAAASSLPDVAAFDVSVSTNTLRYLRQLHRGRVDPRAIGFRMTVPLDDHDDVAVMQAALVNHTVSELSDRLAPPLALYRGLRGVLARYRALAATKAAEAGETLDVSSPTPVKPGEPFAGAGALRRRLTILGDLPAEAPMPVEPATYDEALVDAVKHFQARHGLEADGVIGRSTQEALRVPLSRRVRQIELALERLRWLPHLSTDRFLGVNIPMFRLWAWDAVPPTGAPSFALNVIVGRALDTRTPVFVEDMTHVIFRPYWNVPPSILRGELLPALRRDPAYFDRHAFEIVSGQSDDATPVALTPASVQQLEQGRLRVRQRPGPNNSLGLVKFVFPNDENVYMHGTPAAQLFSRSRRDFSHGCVRVQDPIALAEWALRGQGVWTRERIVEAMHADRPTRVDLDRPIQVILFYVTAVVMPDDGTVHFADDIYGHDARLDRALTPAPRPASGSGR